MEKMSVGKRIYKHRENLNPTLVERFREYPSANVSDCMERLYSMNAYIKPYGKQKKIIGQALTVKASIADNMLFHQALLMANPGDVIVVEAGRDMNHSICGDIMYSIAKSKDIAGFVVDGCIRDVDYLLREDFPVFAAGVTGRGPYKNGPGEVNVDISCGGQVVHPGDIILGDEDGIVVIPPLEAEDILLKVEALITNENKSMDMIEKGEWEKGTLAKNIKQHLEDNGYQFID
ncbi:RraA family protein [Alkalicoccobacillus porphyridii]|uniref:Putative 4-hydroxy-4-methyl-2-oxoglutarate aldolase n=1 Tax=Alkalicoccobacillus porphyridii TaxID=2597270 RepID=A0A553ZWQ3_9BACI|nr:RraA family protein [Alkalicoccobacillus porphyridii]TSB45897.1 RraA family protein [Alkalicoccobacillus porphyridii]